MSTHNPADLTIQESWASAFVDGEVSLLAQAGWDEHVHEQLYYYTVMRQVLRGDMSHGREPNLPSQFCAERTTWVAFWARVDAAQTDLT